MLFAKSLLLNYLLDRELVRMGSSLDALMAHLYQNFGLAGRRWSQRDIPAALQTLTGQSLDAFFSMYLAGTARLPLDGTFTLFPR
jgi:predicted metalloprotease with PDZ domain